MHRLLRASKSKKANQERVFPMQQLSNNLLSNSPDRRNTGRFGRAQEAGQQPGEFLTRHVNREWGDLSDEDRKENDYSLEHGFRILMLPHTRWRQVVDYHRSDRSVTTLLLPDEY